MLKNWGVYLIAMFIRCRASLLNAMDIPALEMKYAQVYLSRKTVKFLSQLSAKDMDREFLIAIEKEFLDTDWYRYELAHLSSAAEEWCKENHIRYTN